MESELPAGGRERGAAIAVSVPGGLPATIPLEGVRVTAGRLAETNAIALRPDPQLLVSRTAHCAFVRRGDRWYVEDGGGVNGTHLRRDGSLERVAGPEALRGGDVVCVLAEVTPAGERRWFELAFLEGGDAEATRAAPEPAGAAAACLSYDAAAARLVLVRAGERHEIPIRAQAHRLVRHMAERNAGAGGSALCTHDELMQAVWAGEPLHTREELAKLVWELRRKLEPFGAEHLLENERRLGYRLRTC